MYDITFLIELYFRNQKVFLFVGRANGRPLAMK